MRTRTHIAIALGAVAAVVAAGCSGDDATTASTTTEAATPPASTASTTTSPREGRVIDDIDLGPDDFSDPTAITNELFPVSEVPFLVMLGEDEGEPLRVEVTLLPETKTIDWEGGSTETVVSQFVAITDGELVEVAVDWFAQDDDGNVWYFGEDVENFEAGEVVDTDGSWIAGDDGPPGMIMPADPQVGDIYHPENIPGFVFEEDVVLATDETVDGPSGSINGVLLVEERLMDGDVETKYWAPGYGEFRAIHPGVEDVVVVFALPNDAQPEPVPSSLGAVQGAAHEAFDLALEGAWDALGDSLATIDEGWTDYGVDDRPVVPEQFVEAVEEARDELAQAIEDEDGEAAAEAAVALELATLDVVLTHGSLADEARVGALEQQAELADRSDDAAAAANTAALIATLLARG
jgi:hypothetical protein